VIFTDEKTFLTFKANSKRWYKKGESNTKPKPQHPVSRMAFGGVSRLGPLGLGWFLPVDTNEKAGLRGINSEKYCAMLEEQLMVEAGELYPDRQWKLQEDGAKVHKSKETTLWKESQGINLLSSGWWPACSPDLNPTEHLWSWVEGQLLKLKGNDRPTTAQELMAAVDSIF
jgi:hypothetical protein